VSVSLPNLRPKRVRRNIVANAIGRVWSLLLSLGVLPLYVRFLGAEAYGLIGLYAILVSICSLFDTGITTSLGRELARADKGDARTRNAELIRTAEIIYGSLGVGLGALVALAAPWIIDRWLNLHTMKPEVAIAAVRLMGLYLIFQWPTSIYYAALSGLQKQVELNVVTLLGSSVRTIGAAVILLAFSRSILVFYMWQAASSALYLVLCREVVWRSPEVIRRAAAFRWRLVYDVRRFAGGVTVMTAITVGVSQLDKIVLTRLIPLDAFGYYSFAATIAGAAAGLGAPILSATYPAMIEAHTAQDHVRLAALFHKSAQLVAVVTFAPSAIVCAFSYAVLLLWTRDPVIASHTAALLSVYIFGVALNVVATMPYNLTLAAGSLRASMIIAVVGFVVFAVALAVLAPRMGAMGGAVGSAVVAAVGLPIYAPFVSRILPRQAARWIVEDVLLPMATAWGVAFLLSAAFAGQTARVWQACSLAAASLVTLLCCVAGTRLVREEAVLRLRMLRWPRLF
jgi:O-antigen/teichoic acid export membrane protein